MDCGCSDHCGAGLKPSSAAGLHDVGSPNLPLGGGALVPAVCSGSMQFGVQSTQILS